MIIDTQQLEQPLLSPRKRPLFSLEELISNHTISPSLANRVLALLRADKKGLITGTDDSGKTTLLQALLPHLPVDSDLLIFEQYDELQQLPSHARRINTLRLEDDACASRVVFDELWYANKSADIRRLLKLCRGFIATQWAASTSHALRNLAEFPGLFSFVLHCEITPVGKSLIWLLTIVTAGGSVFSLVESVKALLANSSDDLPSREETAL